MTSTNSRIDLLTEAMSIEKERAALQLKLDRMHSRLDQIKTALFSAGTGAAAGPIARTANVAAKTGSLKERILGALASVGDAGIRVRDLAVTIGAKPAALHSWFQFARRSLPVIRRTGPGRYRLAGPLPATRVALASNRAAAAPKAGKSSKVNRRGQLAESVLGALEAAKGKAVTIAEMASRFDVNPKNLFVWFSTTGKKHKMIKKVGPGTYCIKG